MAVRWLFACRKRYTCLSLATVWLVLMTVAMPWMRERMTRSELAHIDSSEAVAMSKALPLSSQAQAFADRAARAEQERVEPPRKAATKKPGWAAVQRVQKRCATALALRTCTSTVYVTHFRYRGRDKIVQREHEKAAKKQCREYRWI